MISRFCPVLLRRTKSSCNVRMCPPNPSAPQHPHVSTLLCSISSWNSPGQAPSLPDISLVLLGLNSLTYIVFPTALPLHICLAQHASPGLFWGKLPRRSCYFVSKTSPPTSLALTGAVATSSFPANNLRCNYKPGEQYVSWAITTTQQPTPVSHMQAASCNPTLLTKLKTTPASASG